MRFQREVSKGCVQVREISSDVKSLEQPHGPEHGKAFSFCELASLMVVQKDGIRLAFLCQKNRAQLSCTKRMLLEEHSQSFVVAERSTFYPSGVGNFRRSRQAFSGNHHLFVNFG